MDASAADRVLLQSSKPSVHMNVDCTALAAAVVGRQVSVVDLLLQVSILCLSINYWNNYGGTCGDQV